jgi:hypothetical protein
LVALGNKQKYGVDFDKTFAPVPKMISIRIILTIVAYQGWSLTQMDVKNAFMHGDLAKNIYMTLPNLKVDASINAPYMDCDKLHGHGLEIFGLLLYIDFSFTQSQFDFSLFIHRTLTAIVLLFFERQNILITRFPHKTNRNR